MFKFNSIIKVKLVSIIKTDRFYVLINVFEREQLTALFSLEVTVTMESRYHAHT